uniref:15-cis-phytoene synthase n=1 Tax=Dictyopteris undulata TaxID=156997 RepID=A0A2D2AH02_9PHAE|nr:phytoene synthetase [Dictyopteris undulata]
MTRDSNATRGRRQRSALLAALALPCVSGFAFSPQVQSLGVQPTITVITDRQSSSRFAGSCVSAGRSCAGGSPCTSMTTSTGSMSKAMENAKRLSKGDLDNLELVRGPAESQRRTIVLNQAYAECERITGIFAKTFYLGTKFMSPVGRKAIWAIYVWCRRTDDIVDGPRAMVRGKKSMQQELADWTVRLEDVWRGKPRDALDLALVDVRESYPSLPIAPFKDMIDGMVMDVPGIGKNRYQTFKELELYCYRVAGTVGLMTLPILKTAEGVSQEDAKFPALSLGIALQLTNILRDVGEDAVRGRIYLPLEDLERFGVDPENIMNGILDSNYKALMKFQISRARFYYKQAQRGIPMLAAESRLPVQASLDMYSKILRAIETNDYDNFRKRAYTSKTEKLLTLPLSWWRSVNVGKVELDIDEREFEVTRFDKIELEREPFPQGFEE